MLTRRTPMRRTALRSSAPAPRPAKQTMAVARPREVATASVALPMAKAQPKNPSLVSEAYRATVRKMACARCGIVGFSQFCHSDEGKGIGYKTDDRTGWPGCGPHNNEPGCHWFVGTSGRMPKAERREFEARAAAATRAAVLATGKWPMALPMFNDEREAEAA